jgi:hypothetical protein
MKIYHVVKKLTGELVEATSSKERADHLCNSNHELAHCGGCEKEKEGSWDFPAILKTILEKAGSREIPNLEPTPDFPKVWAVVNSRYGGKVLERSYDREELNCLVNKANDIVGSPDYVIVLEKEMIKLNKEKPEVEKLLKPILDSVVNEHGAKRGSDRAKFPFHMLPTEALEAWAAAMYEGKEKYGDWNWLKGFPVSTLIDHAAWHLSRAGNGDKAEDHLGHAMWNIGTAIFFLKNRPELDDLPQKEIRYGFVGNKHKHQQKDGPSAVGGGGSVDVGDGGSVEPIRG